MIVGLLPLNELHTRERVPDLCQALFLLKKVLSQDIPKSCVETLCDEALKMAESNVEQILVNASIALMYILNGSVYLVL